MAAGLPRPSSRAISKFSAILNGGNMRALRTPVWMLVLVLVAFSISQAKTNYAYVANNATNTVSVINTSTNAVVKTIAVGSGPYAVAINQAGSNAYVANFSSNTVSVITTSTNTVTATIAVGSGPTNLVFAPNGKTAFVTNSTSNSVSVINTS